MKLTAFLLSLLLLSFAVGLTLLSGLVPSRLMVSSFEITNPLFPYGETDLNWSAIVGAAAFGLTFLYMAIMLIVVPGGRRQRTLTGISKDQIPLDSERFLPLPTALDRMRELAARL